MFIKRLILPWVVVLSILTAGAARAQSTDGQKGWPGAAVRTNLFWDAAAEPNIGLEFPLGQHFSLGANAGIKTWPRWLFWDNENIQNTTHWRNFAVVPEARYYFDQVYQGLFLAGDLIYTHFNVGNVKFPFGLYPDARDYRLQGDFVGAGVSLGRSWWLGSHWRVEAEAGVGVGYVNANKFECAHCGTQVGTKEGVALVPKLGLNIAYNFKRREQKKQEILEIVSLPKPPLMKDPEPEPQPVPEPEPALEPEPDPIAPILLHPVVRLSSEYRPYTPERVLRKEEGALYVFFPVSKSALERSFTEGGQTRDNGPVLDEILQVTEEILNTPSASVSCIQIVGLASIEGSKEYNQAISLARAKALQQYIQDRVPVPDALFETVGGGEAWTELKDIVQDLMAGVGESALSQAQLQQVLDVLENETDPARRERKLKALDGGRVYRILNGSLLKDLRNSGYVRVYIDKK